MARYQHNNDRKPAYQPKPPVILAMPPLPQLPDILKPCANILITGAIGDFFAIESFMYGLYKDVIHTVFYATRQKNSIEELFSLIPNKVSRHISLWDDFSNFWCFTSKNELLERKPELYRNLSNCEESLANNACCCWFITTCCQTVNVMTIKSNVLDYT